MQKAVAIARSLARAYANPENLMTADGEAAPVGNKLKVLVDGDGMKLLMNLYQDYVSEEDYINFLEFAQDVDTLLYRHRGNRPLTREEKQEMNETSPKKKTGKPRVKAKKKVVNNGDAEAGAVSQPQQQPTQQITSAATKTFSQDGADFYDEDTEQLVAFYPRLVKNDHDMAGAKKAREQFLKDHPEYKSMEASSIDMQGAGSKAFKAAKAELAKLGVVLQHTGDDYRVVLLENAKNKDLGSFTDDLDDAIATGKHMAEERKKKQSTASMPTARMFADSIATASMI